MRALLRSPRAWSAAPPRAWAESTIFSSSMESLPPAAARASSRSRSAISAASPRRPRWQLRSISAKTDTEFTVYYEDGAVGVKPHADATPDETPHKDTIMDISLTPVKVKT